MRGAPGGYKSDKGLQWFQWGMKEINYFARLMDFDIEWVQIEHNITGPDGGTLSDRYWPHRYVWCYKRKLIK